MENTVEKSANARDQHVTWPRGLLHGGSPMVDECHVTSAYSQKQGCERSSELLPAADKSPGPAKVHKHQQFSRQSGACWLSLSHNKLYSMELK